MDEQPRHTPGPYELRPVGGENDVEVYSATTGEPLATVHALSWTHEDAPREETALHNAALFKAAPRMRQTLESILGARQEQLREATADKVRALLEEINAGPGEAFFKERKEQRRKYEESSHAQGDEMALQSDSRPGEESEREDEDQDEEHGPSFGF